MQDSIFQVIFYFFAVLAMLSAFLTIVQSNPVRSVLFLVLTFFASAVIWMMFAAEFLSLILILVYVGAVMTLFLFVVMMLNIDVEMSKKSIKKYAPLGLIPIALLSGMLMISLPKNWSTANSGTTSSSLPSLQHNKPLEKNSNTRDLGLVLYTDYFLAFEMAAALLLVAIISAITLVQRKQKNGKTQFIVNQIMTDPKDRIRLIKLKTEL